MNISIFVDKLTQFIETTDESTHLYGVCDLLRLHTAASVQISGQLGLEILHNDCVSGKHNLDLGSLKLTRDTVAFTDDETLAAKVTLSICTVLLINKKRQMSADKKRRQEAVRGIINTLSFSELDAAVHVIRALEDNDDGLLVAGHIADKLGFTRSIVTAALRKLEGAGLVETRSLGMKGTYVKVLDPILSAELSKL